MKLIIGLGNPAEKYKNNRHNIGFIAIEQLGKDLGISIDKRKKFCLFGKGKFSGKDLILLKPLTFMNLSGEAIVYLANYYNIPTDDIIVIHDDCSIPVGKLKIKRDGSDGGHNGIKSVIYSLNDKNFIRIKLGIGSPPDGMALEDYVLSNFTREEIPVIQETVQKASDAIKTIITFSLQKAMNEFNRKS